MLEISCLAWSLANTSLPTLPDLELGWRAASQDTASGQPSALARHLTSNSEIKSSQAGRQPRQPRTAAEVSDFISSVTNHHNLPPLSDTIKVDLCVPLLVLLPMFILPNIFPQNPDPKLPIQPPTPTPTILSQYTVRPLPTPPNYWTPNRNLTNLPPPQQFPDNVTYKSKVEIKPTTAAPTRTRTSTKPPPPPPVPSQPIYIGVEAETEASVSEDTYEEYQSDFWVEVPAENQEPNLTDYVSYEDTPSNNGYGTPLAPPIDTSKPVASMLTKYGSDLLKQYGKAGEVAAPLTRDMIWKLIRGGSSKDEGDNLQFSSYGA